MAINRVKTGRNEYGAKCTTIGRYEGKERLATLLLLEDIIYPDGLYIESLQTQAEYRNQGHASALILHAIALAEKRGASFLSLDTYNGDADLVRFYEKFGFICTDWEQTTRMERPIF